MDEDAPIQQPRTVFVSKFFNRLDHYKRLARKYWWVLLLTCAASLVVQYYILKHEPPSYISNGRMIVNYTVSIPEIGTYHEPDPENFFGTQVALMQSKSVVQRVINRMEAQYPQMKAKPVDIAVAVVPKSSIFSLQATGDDANYTQAYLQATMEEYINLKRELLAAASSTTQTSLSDELQTIGLELQKAKQAVADFQGSNDVVFITPGGGYSAADYLSSLTHDLEKDRSDLAELEGLTLDQSLERDTRKYQEQQATGQAPDPAPKPAGAPAATKVAPASPTNEDILIAGLPPNLGTYEQDYLITRQKLVILKAKRAGLLKVNPKLESTAPELAPLDQEIAENENLLKSDQAQAEENLKNRKFNLKRKILTDEKLVKEWQGRALDSSKKLTRYAELQAEAAQKQKRYDAMEADLQRLKVDKSLGPESVTLLETATGGEAILPQAEKHLIMAALIGLFVGAGIVVFIDRLDDRPRTVTDLEQLFNMPVLGQLPLMKPQSRRAAVPILQLEDSRYPVIEAYQSLRSALFYTTAVKSQPKSIMITSARPDDGKSMVSSNFAITLAQTGARVLLVDADLRRGVLHRHFSTDASPGLSDVLAEKCSWTEATYKTSVPNLDLVPCGAPPKNPSMLFATAKNRLADLPKNYDFYLFDTVPVMVGDDVLSFAPHVDGVIMVVRAGFTSGRLVQAALDSLSFRGVNVFGLAFNAVNPKTSDYYNYRFKEYYKNRPL
jgi:polysaccharide biosynthesis transport protein